MWHRLPDRLLTGFDHKHGLRSVEIEILGETSVVQLRHKAVEIWLRILVGNSALMAKGANGTHGSSNGHSNGHPSDPFNENGRPHNVSSGHSIIRYAFPSNIRLRKVQVLI